MENKSIYTALAEFRQKVQPIEKEATNPHFKSKYADLASIIEAIKQPLKDCGLTLHHTVVSVDGSYEVHSTLTHGTESIVSTFPLFGTKAQDLGSSITYARRYNTQALLDLPTVDDDDGNKANEAPRTTVSDKPFITKTSIEELVKHLQEGVIVCSSADEAIQVARKKYKVAKWAEDEIKEKTKSIFI